MEQLKSYSIKKARQILLSGYKWYKKRKNQLAPLKLQEFESELKALEQACNANDQETASHLAHAVDNFCRRHFKKTSLEYILEMATAIVIALVIATIVRQSWFELYEIPTGSMRPTFKEQDHLSVTKTAFGINIPLKTEHAYFDSTLVQRTSVVIWSGDGIAHLDSNSTFMGIFPYTKRYIKRCMGKPGDTLYFYGGKIYGFDKDGNDLVELRDNPWTANLEHVPFTRFDGRESFNAQQKSQGRVQLTYHHFNQAIGRVLFSRQGFTGDVFNGKEWVKDNPLAQKVAHNKIETYSDWWGIRNFAIARLLTKEQLVAYTSYNPSEMEEGLLYLEMRHSPSLSYPSPLLLDRGIAYIKGFSTVIPLQERHLKALMENMYTCRFVIENGRATSYGQSHHEIFSLKELKKIFNKMTGHEVFKGGFVKINPANPPFPGVSDGSYEFYYGKGVKVGWGAITSLLQPQNPLLSSSVENIQKLFNVGIDMTTLVEPNQKDQLYFPNRYVYYREGSLYAMGGVLMEKNDSSLVSFAEREQKREALSSAEVPYVAFKDFGPPLTKDGQLDKEFIKTFGLKIPQGHYLMLGDNHAMSQDSRYFGPVPEANLQGAPSLILWPPGDRFGFPNQKPYPLITLPRLIVWSIVALVLGLWWIIARYRSRRKLRF